MAWAEMGVTAGGSTCYEAARLGLPCLAIVLAENQRPVVDGLSAHEVLWNLGWHNTLSVETISAAIAELSVDPDRRSRMSEAGQVLVPGGGAQRVVQAMIEASSDRGDPPSKPGCMAAP